MRTIAMETPQGARVVAPVEPTPWNDTVCPVCRALDHALRSVGVVDVRVGARCAVCGSEVVEEVGGV